MAKYFNLFSLAKLKNISKEDLHFFFEQNHTSFQLDTITSKYFLNLNELTVNIAQNSANSFYLGTSHSKDIQKADIIVEDCSQDVPNCQHLPYYDSKGKKLHIRFKDQFKANFFCRCKPNECPHHYLFLTGTYKIGRAHV